MSKSSHSKGNFTVRHRFHKKKNKFKELSVEDQNMLLVKKFQKKFKQSGIIKELRDKVAPMTRGQKRRAKIKAGIRRSKKTQKK
tara:strand:+ start:232 stop:483 length:252 start_codon:yes stop_codon:yes gene_type:complete